VHNADAMRHKAASVIADARSLASNRLR
jgi:hypothetical protein